MTLLPRMAVVAICLLQPLSALHTFQPYQRFKATLANRHQQTLILPARKAEQAILSAV